MFIVAVLSLVNRSLTLTLISGDRFFGIVFALRSHVSRRPASALIAVTWLTSVVVALPFLFFRIERRRVWSDFEEVYCADAWPESLAEFSDYVFHKPPKTVYYMSISVFLFFLPIFVMTTAYSLVIRKLLVTSSPGEHVSAVSSAHAQQERTKKKVILI